jgi:hypothetical protein
MQHKTAKPSGLTIAGREYLEGHGFSSLSDGSCAKEVAPGRVVSSYSEDLGWGDEVDGTSAECHERAEQHKQHVTAFKASIAKRRLEQSRKSQSTQTARQPRPRARGTGRRPKAQATRSSARSGDSGDDGLSESEEPPGKRGPCALCGRPIPASRRPQAKHCSDKHADLARKHR